LGAKTVMHCHRRVHDLSKPASNNSPFRHQACQFQVCPYVKTAGTLRLSAAQGGCVLLCPHRSISFIPLAIAHLAAPGLQLVFPHQ
jgi:hypothetical protein